MPPTADLLLIAGLWIDGSAWDPVVRELAAIGRRGVPIRLPGQGVPPPDATLEDQLAVVLKAVDAAGGPITVVGHSAASTLAWMAADRRPGTVARVAMVGGFPAQDGATYASMFDMADGVMPFPGWEPFEGPDAADLDASQRQALAAAAIPVPEGVATGTVRLSDERRYGVPVTLICPEYSATQARAWVESGTVPELGPAKDVQYVDIDSGHWPMVTRPAELAAILAGMGDA